MQTLYLLPAAVGQVWGLAVHGGQKELGVGQQGVGPLQVSPQLLLHVKISVAHLEDRTSLLTYQILYKLPIKDSTILNDVIQITKP